MIYVTWALGTESFIVSLLPFYSKIIYLTRNLIVISNAIMSWRSYLILNEWHLNSGAAIIHTSNSPILVT